MTLHHRSTSRDIAEHIIEAARTDARWAKIVAEAEADLVEHAKRVDPQALDYLARKREADALTRRHRLLTVLLVALLGVMLFGAMVWADPVARLAHDTARPAYCGAC